MLVSNDGIKIRSSLYERAKKIDVFSTVGIRTRKFQSHINLCYSRCWYHMMEYKSHQAYVKGQKNKKKNYFPLPRFKPENFKVINLCYNRCWHHMMEYKSHQAYVKGQKKKELFSATRIQIRKFQSHINLCYNGCWYHMME
jgi:hypothetical protein